MEAHLTKAEKLWKTGLLKEAIVEYDAALAWLKEHPDRAKEEMVLVGKGYALANSGEVSDLKIAKGALLKAQGMTTQEAAREFIGQLLRQVEDNIKAGVVSPIVPAQVKGGGCSSHSTDNHDPCLTKTDHEGHVLGLDKEGAAMMDIVAREGAPSEPGGWAHKAHEIAERSGESEKTAQELFDKWKNVVAGKIKEGLKANPTLPCGHTCNTCPTKDTCHLHDIEDLV